MSTSYRTEIVTSLLDGSSELNRMKSIIDDVLGILRGLLKKNIKWEDGAALIVKGKGGEIERLEVLRMSDDNPKLYLRWRSESPKNVFVGDSTQLPLRLIPVLYRDLPEILELASGVPGVKDDLDFVITHARETT